MDDFTPSTSFTEDIEEIYDYSIIRKELATMNPLHDRAFRILLTDYEILASLVEILTGDKVSRDKIYHFNPNIVIKVKNKEVELDNIAGFDNTLYNIEGQNKASEFTYKRHLFYWATIFSHTLQKSDDYDDVKSVVSIVVYQDKGNKDLFQHGYVAGDIFTRVGDKDLLSLISINAKQWRVAKNEKLRAFLSLVYNGIYSEQNKHMFDDVDIKSEFFKQLCSAMIISCSQVKYEEVYRKGDEKMATLYKSFITEEERLKAEAKGREEGIIRGGVKILYNKFNYTPEQISSTLNISIEEVEQIIKSLK